MFEYRGDMQGLCAVGFSFFFFILFVGKEKTCELFLRFVLSVVVRRSNKKRERLATENTRTVV